MSDVATESVWDYPRPPRLEPSSERVVVTHAGLVLADTTASLRVLETSHPPTYYLPASSFATGVLRPAGGASWCEWKGQASYLDLVVGDQVLTGIAWTYPEPSARLRGAARPRGALPGSGGPVHRRRRGRAAAARELLRRLDHLAGDRSLQGRARHLRLVSVSACPRSLTVDRETQITPGHP